MVKNLISAFTTFLALMLQSEIASGNLVETHMIVSKYLFVFGRGPTQLTMTALNGSSTAGIGCYSSGTIGTF